MNGQISMFDLTLPMITVPNRIRLIELFAGYGSHAMALEEIGADFEHWKISEWECNANRSYKAVHIEEDYDYSAKYSRKEIIKKLLGLGISGDGKRPMTLKEIGRKPEKWQRKTYNEFRQCHNLGSIIKIHGTDLEITDTDKYTYFLTYSFPCTDLSVAGRQAGMSKGSGTRSGLLWEVERILKEIADGNGELPQLLFMENVPQVISKANIKDFHAWQDFLAGLGYTNHVQILNAKDYGIAQNRERCFMFSFLGQYNYKFPEPIPLKNTIKNYLEDEVDEKYYINTEKARKLIQQLIDDGTLPGTEERICTEEVKQVANLIEEGGNFQNPQRGRVYNTEGIAPTICTYGGGNLEPKIIVAMRGRNPENSKSREAGLPTEQRLEPNTQGICNTLTTVQKDNMVLEAAILTPKRTEYGKQIRKAYESGIVNESRHNMTKLEPRNDGIANTLTTVQKDNLLLEGTYEMPGTNYNQRNTVHGENAVCRTLISSSHAGNEPKVLIKQATKEGYIECQLGGVADLSFPESKTRRGCVQEGGQVSPTLTATGSTELYRIETAYRIRKLTPRECGRLMDVKDEDITKMEEVNSNSQLYKQYGNSIVKRCMVAMFSNLNIQGLPRWEEIKDRY